jgi:hypothetical protein
MAHLDQRTRWWIGDRHGERDPNSARDLWCGGCIAWTDESAWHRHAWHHPAGSPRSGDRREPAKGGVG